MSYLWAALEREALALCVHCYVWLCVVYVAGSCVISADLFITMRRISALEGRSELCCSMQVTAQADWSALSRMYIEGHLQIGILTRRKMLLIFGESPSIFSCRTPLVHGVWKLWILPPLYGVSCNLTIYRDVD